MKKEEAHRILDEAKKGLHTEQEITRALWATGDITPRILLKQKETEEELYFPIIEPPKRTVIRMGKKIHAEAL